MHPARALLALVLAIAAAACGGSSSKPEKPAETPPGATKAPEPASTPPPQASVDLGQERRDPPWFRPDAVAGTTVFRSSRTEADAQGRFSSQLLLDFPAGTTVEQCAERLRELVAPHVPELVPTVGSDGRITLRGQTPTYGVTLLCGAVPDRVRAYVGYNWTQ